MDTAYERVIFRLKFFAGAKSSPCVFPIRQPPKFVLQWTGWWKYYILQQGHSFLYVNVAGQSVSFLHSLFGIQLKQHPHNFELQKWQEGSETLFVKPLLRCHYKKYREDVYLTVCFWFSELLQWVPRLDTVTRANARKAVIVTVHEQMDRQS